MCARLREKLNRFADGHVSQPSLAVHVRRTDHWRLAILPALLGFMYGGGEQEWEVPELRALREQREQRERDVALREGAYADHTEAVQDDDANAGSAARQMATLWRAKDESCAALFAELRAEMKRVNEHEQAPRRPRPRPIPGVSPLP